MRRGGKEAMIVPTSSKIDGHAANPSLTEKSRSRPRAAEIRARGARKEERTPS